MLTDYDVVVVGSGPAGSCSALHCSKRGLKTLLLDRQQFPRIKPCGGILEGKYFVKLAPFMVGKEENITHYTSLFYNYNKLCVRPLKSYIYKREKFDAQLVDHAILHGVEFHDETSVTGLTQDKNSVTIFLQTHRKINEKYSIRTKLCIGADGMNSSIRRWSGLEKFRAKHDKLITLVIPEAVPKNDLPWEVTTEYNKSAIASYFFSGFPGFAWLAPAKETINVGIGVPVEFSKQIKVKFEQFLTHVSLDHEINKAIAYSIPYMALKQIYSGRVMLVGDAAGMVDPWTGGGINWGFRSGITAAKVAAEFLTPVKDKTNTMADISIYQSRMQTLLKQLRFKAKLLRFLLWCYNHKMNSPGWEQFMLKHAFPNV